MTTPQIYALRRAIDILGTQRAVAQSLGVSDVAVGQWLKPPDDKASRNIPPKHCVRIETLTNCAVGRCELRPHDWKDYWPEMAYQMQKTAQTPASSALAATENVAQGAAHG